MPITKVRLQNFKCFEDSGDIPLAPLTILFGRNNTGKSSILHSLLLLKQTVDSPGFGPRLITRGPQYSAGNYVDFVHQHRLKQHVTMTFSISTPDGRSGSIQLEFSADEPQPPRLNRVRVAITGVNTLEIRRGRGKDGPYELVIGGEALGNEKGANFGFHVNRFLPIIGPEPVKVGRPNMKRERSRATARRFFGELEETLRSLRAVGAFRRQPERRYEFLGQVTGGADSIGERVVEALIEDSIRRSKTRGTLLKGVNQWLKQVGRVRLLPFRRISKSARIFEIRLRDTDSGRWANFADVGFGIGQAFPVLVEGLRTPFGGTFLVQEPEMHLHPDAQLAMADFLVSLVRSGRRVIVESHSEHLLLRIRHRIALGTKSRGRLAKSDVSLVFVDKTQDGTSHAKVLQVDELGQIENWPKGFMEDATRERIALLTAQAKRAEAGK